ncbi:MAG: RNA polymerase sigma factor [Planctomycetota bacterium]|jgi:RNA polymerase sigma factor (sigma-70 family)
MTPETTQNESALVCAARRGDKEALHLLLRTNWPWLKALVYGIVSDGHDLDDLMQGICLRVISRIGSLREPERFRPWLATLAQRHALGHRRRKNKRPIPLSDEIARRICDEKADRLFENLQRKEQCRLILDAIASLPEIYRRVFVLQYAGDLTYAQLAEILDIPVTTVQIRLVRARRMILERVTGKQKDKVVQT